MNEWIIHSGVCINLWHMARYELCNYWKCQIYAAPQFHLEATMLRLWKIYSKEAIRQDQHLISPTDLRPSSLLQCTPPLLGITRQISCCKDRLVCQASLNRYHLLLLFALYTWQKSKVQLKPSRATSCLLNSLTASLTATCRARCSCSCPAPPPACWSSTWPSWRPLGSWVWLAAGNR